GNSSLLRPESDQTLIANSHKKILQNGHVKANSWYRFFNPVHIWQQWRLSKSVNRYNLHEQLNGKETGTLANGMNVLEVRRESKDSNDTTEHTCANGLSLSCLCCCWPSCDTVGHGRS